MANSEYVLEMHGICKYFPGVKALDGVELLVRPGTVHTLMGENGAGKSTLLRMINALEVPTSGKVFVKGIDINEISAKQLSMLRKDIGIIFQDFQLLHDRTVFKNLEFVLRATGWKKKEEIKQRIEEVLEAVGMTDKMDKMPHELSGGEQQRIAIARAILNSPKVIIADEPTGNLDPETATLIVNLLKNISMSGTAVVMTTHNIPMLDLVPGIVYRCKDGRMADVTADYNKMDLSEDAEGE